MDPRLRIAVGVWIGAACALVACAGPDWRPVRAYHPAVDMSRLDWIEVRGPTFSLRSDAPAHEVEALAADLEAFAATVQHATGIEAKPRRSTIYAIEDPRVRAASIPEHARAYRAALSSGGAIVAPMAGDHEARDLLKHEIVHELMMQQPVHYPAWYEEGLAVYLSTLSLRGDLATAGYPDRERARGVIDDGRIPLEILLSPLTKRLETPGFYENAWLFVHFLHHGRIADGTSPLDRGVDYLERLHRGEDWRQAFEAAFAESIDAFDRHLDAYLDSIQRRLRVLDLAAPIRQAPKIPDAAPIAPSRVAAELGEASARWGRGSAAIAMVAPWARGNRFEPRAGAVFALAEAVYGARERSSAAIDRALAAAPSDPQIWLLAGDVSAMLADATTPPDASQVLQARSRYARARELGCRDPDLERRLALTYAAGAPQDDFETRRRILEAALANAHPEDGALLLGLGQLHADAGQANEARRYLQQVLAVSAEPKYRAKAQAALDRLSEGERS